MIIDREYLFQRKEERPMKTIFSIVRAALIAALVAIPFAVPGAQGDPEERAALARALQDARVPLEQGLSASVREGTPISAKYEIDDGKFQLSVYTMKDDGFHEVIVDHATGTISKAFPITDGGDLVAARKQKEVLALAKRSLEVATAEVVRNNAGYRAVSAMPRLADGRSIVDVTLTNGQDWKTVPGRLTDDDYY
jgi:hypothetical protein